MATDPHMQNIEALLSPQPGESSGYITRDDIVAAFREALLAVAEQEVPQEDVVIGALQKTVGKSGLSLLQVVEGLGDVLSQWKTNLDVMGSPVPAALPQVGGDPVPSTIASTVQVLNNLIQSLESLGLVRDVRGAVPPVTPPVAVAITGLVAPTPPAFAFTFAPANATVPVNLKALVADAAVGDVALAAASQVAFTRAQYIALADGSRATWDATNWSVWTPPITGITPPTGVNNFEWTFLPANSAVIADLATLKADATVGDAALSALATIDFTSGQFITLGDGSKAYFGADSTAGPAGGMSWQKGVAP